MIGGCGGVGLVLLLLKLMSVVVFVSRLGICREIHDVHV